MDRYHNYVSLSIHSCVMKATTQMWSASRCYTVIGNSICASINDDLIRFCRIGSNSTVILSSNVKLGACRGGREDPRFWLPGILGYAAMFRSNNSGYDSATLTSEVACFTFLRPHTLRNLHNALSLQTQICPNPLFRRRQYGNFRRRTGRTRTRQRHRWALWAF